MSLIRFNATHINGKELDTPESKSVHPSRVQIIEEAAGGVASIKVINHGQNSITDYLTVEDYTNIAAQGQAYADVAVVGVQNTVFQAQGTLTAADTAGQYQLGSGGAARPEATASASIFSYYHLDPSTYASVSGASPSYRVKANMATNSTAPFATGNITVYLVPVTGPTGGAGVLGLTLGAAVTNSTVTFANPIANRAVNDISDTFQLSAGYYALVVETDTTIDASAHLGVSATLEMFYV